MVNIRAKILDFGGFDSGGILTLRGGLLMSVVNFPEDLSQQILVGIILVGRLGVCKRRTRNSPVAPPDIETIIIITIIIMFLIISSSSSSSNSSNSNSSSSSSSSSSGSSSTSQIMGNRLRDRSSDHTRPSPARYCQLCRLCAGLHYLSNATCLIRPHLFYAYFVVSMITVICFIICHF